MKHKGSTLILRAVILLITFGVLTLCIFVFPFGIMNDRTGDYRPLLIGMYIPAIPFFFGEYQAWRLLNLIDKNKAFSQSAVNVLNRFKLSAFAISAFYAVGLPYIFYVADQDDAPGVVLIGLIFTFAPLMIGVFAGVLQHLLSNAIDIKSKNDEIV